MDKISINPAYNKETRILFVLPQSQIIPLIICCTFAYLLAAALSLDMGIVLAMIAGTFLPWWFQTGDDPHKIIDQLFPPPGRDFAGTEVPYISIFSRKRSTEIKALLPDEKLTIRQPMVTNLVDFKSKGKFAPFINFQHLVAPIKMRVQGKEIGGFFLEKGDRCQIVFLLKYNPQHHSLSDQEAEVANRNIQLGINRIPDGESVRFFIEKRSSFQDRNRGQHKINQGCNSKRIKELHRSNLIKTRKVTQTRQRQVTSYYLTVTATWNKSGVTNDADIKNQVANVFGRLLSNLAESKSVLREGFFAEGFKDAEHKLSQWVGILRTTWGLDVEPLDCQGDHKCLYWY